MIEVKDLYKRFGSVYAVNGITMRAAEGDIYGFIGHNGAGKSTTFKILATILKPDRGTVTVDGVDIRNGDKVRSRIGYMPDMFGVYEDMTVYQYLDFFGAAYYIPSKDRRKLIEDILELTDLAFKRDAMVQSLSRGMTQRLGVARVLVHDPKVLILDEPASGLDPRARVELRELLRELADMGKTVLISSHILSELSEICTRVGIIEQGEFLFEGSRQQLNERLAGHSRIKVETAEEDAERAELVLNEAPFIDHVERDGYTLSVEINDQGSLHDIPTWLVQKQIRLLAFQPADLSLEHAFMALTKGGLA